MAEYKVKITANPKLFELNIKGTLQYSDLIRLFVKKNFVLIYKQTILGPLWLILNPLFSSIIYTFIFGKVVGVSTDGLPAFLFFLTGTSLWNMFTGTLTGTSVTFMNNASIFGKVYFPRLTIPISQAISSILKFAIQFFMLIAFAIFYVFTGVSLPIGWGLLLVPILILQTAILGMSVGIILSSWTIKYRDLSILTGFIVQLWMYMTPVLYPTSYLKGWIYNMVLFNPLSSIIVNFRYALLGSGTFMLLPWVASLFMTIILFFLGVALFNKTEKNFIDII